MRRRWPLFALVIVVAVVVIDAVTRSGRHTSAGTRTVVVDGETVVSPSRQMPVQSGSPNTPRAVLYRFANAYSAVSSATAAQRERVLLSLAAPPLRTHLRAGGPANELTAASAALRRTSIDSLIVSLEVKAPSTGVVHGSVDLEQWVVGKRGSGAPPVRTSYAADLIQEGGDWRVSQFRLMP